MKRIHLSPVTPLLAALTLLFGILVSDLTGLRALSAAEAQTRSEGLSSGRLAGDLIEVKGVLVDGVPTDAVIVGGLGLGGAIIDSGCGITHVGYAETGEPVYVLGVFTSGNVNGVFTSGNVTGADEPGTNGVFTSGNVIPDDEDEPGTNGVFTSGNIYVGEKLLVSGGTLSGSDIQVNNGVISGSDLTVAGSYVSGMCLQ